MESNRTNGFLGTSLGSAIGFALATSVWFGLWSPPVNSESPAENKVTNVRQMSVKERAELGEKLIFGAVGMSQTQFAVGKAVCTLCHDFFKDPQQRPSPPFGPHFTNSFTERIERLVASPEYKQRPKDTEQPEAFPGSGMATSLIEYLAESNVCPSCYVVPGYGVKGTQDRRSLMPKVHKPPISLSIDELIAINTWLYVHDEKEPPIPAEIEKAYRKFIPESEWDVIKHSPR